MSTYVISDIHGCYDEFRQMLELINMDESDLLILAGDYVDRGDRTYEMLKWLEELPSNVIALKGNHDAEFVQNISIMRQIDSSEELGTDPDSNEDTMILYDSVTYMLKRKSSGLAAVYDYYGTLESLIRKNKVTFGELCRWVDILDSFPYVYRKEINGRDCIVVHAGYIDTPEKLPEKYKTVEKFYLCAREDSISLGGIQGGMIVAGHTPTTGKDDFCYNHGEVYRYYDKDRDCIYYDIDCGCSYYEVDPDATMACLRLEDEEVFYLK